MFRAPGSRLRGLLDRLDDLLGDHEPQIAPHPHRRQVRIVRARRPGSVVPRAMHCLCPVRAEPGARRVDERESAR